ncbi:scarecrow-like protein 14 [Rutidosis leptorrhynchoides]|uniref:scarecrow-like protein 14 n=1 Tax=Rutidosis leptorrhynchoides TaxID=125765 RepID=UPI003A99F719
MVMDGRWKLDYGVLNMNAVKFNESPPPLSDPKFLKAMNLNETFVDRNAITRTPELPDSSLKTVSPSTSSNHEDLDLSDVVFKYINQMLMEEDIEEKTCILHESAALQAAEKSFYDALMVNEPPYCGSHPTVPLNDNDENTAGNYNYFDCNTFGNGTNLNCDVTDYDTLIVPSVSVSQSRSQSSYYSSSSNSCVIDCFADSPVSIQSVPANQFQKGIGESGISDQLRFNEANTVVVKSEKKHENNFVLEESRGKKNPYSVDSVEDGRICKQSAVYIEPTVRSKMFDDVLLCAGGKNLPQGNFVPNGVSRVQPKAKTGKGRGKKGVKNDVVDLRTMLSLCAQAVAANDQRSAHDMLKQIREHSSPTGDGMQRVAHYFSAGLEARMAGSGTEIYKALLSKPISAVDVLKAYHLYLSCCPFMKISNFVSNKTILHTAQNKKKLHIVDFGILYGFQWPCFIQRLSKRPGGPPELRITGIDYPCPGFKPSQRVEETGYRLANYAETFGVPFKFKAIAQKWETITLKDLELDSDETLIVNCAYRFRYLLDETVVVDSPRNKVLTLIRKMEPHMFIQGVVNGSYNAPFFITRFREALFYFSSMFDMIEANITRESPDRLLLEKHLWGREAMNVIACEGAERIERPETYKQWQVRNLRAGFRQVPLNQEILKMAKERAKSCYHDDFGIDEDGHWMLQGWKGRIITALSSWKPA